MWRGRKVDGGEARVWRVAREEVLRAAREELWKTARERYGGR